MKAKLIAIGKNAAALGIVVGLWCLYALMAEGFHVLLEGLTAVIFITGIALFVEDTMEKAFYSRELFTWQYLILGLFVIVSDLLWLYWASCDTWLQFALRGLLLIGGIAGTAAWYWFAYSWSVMGDEERRILTLEKAYRKAAKAFPKLDDEGVRDALKEVLFCRLKGDTLEGDLLTGKPLAASYRTYNGIARAGDMLSAERAAAMTNIGQYIEKLIESRHKDDTASAS